MKYNDQGSVEDKTPLQDIDTTAIENIVGGYKDEVRDKVGQQVKQGFDEDLNSREEWEICLDDWIQLAKQYQEEKTYPWPNASNVKYPLVSTAAMQFAARSYPSLVPSNGKIVMSSVIGVDPDGQKFEKAQRVSKYMSYQVMHEMKGWEEGMDRMLMMLPIVGTMFKKTWFDKATNGVRSEVILPKDIVVNYWTTCLEEAERISHVLRISKRKFREMVNQGIYDDIDLGDPTPAPRLTPVEADINSELLPYTLIEQHTFIDLDEDGYPEPYVVTIEYNSGKVVAISRRYVLDNVELDDKDKIIKITPINMFTKFGFIPNPDGSFYDIGFGALLGPLNESVNTLINQLIDSGTLHNLQSGFIGKALKLRMGDTALRPGEWKQVNALGDDLRKQIVPLPTKEPSNVLFQLMGSLITSGKELASVAEIFTGKMPGQNTPATTTMATVEQGMKVFTAVYKRIYRSLLEEFKKIFYLNKLYIDPNKVIKVLDMAIGPNDFDDETCDVIPGADPNAVTNQEKLMKSQGLLELLQMAGPILNPVEIVYRVLEAQEHPNIEKLFSQEVLQTGQIPQQPDPKLLAIQAKAQNDQQKAALDREMKLFDMQLKERDAEFQQAMKAEEHAMDMQQTAEKSMLEASSQVQLANIFSATERMKSQQALVQRDQEHSQKMAQQKEAQSLQKNRSKSGKPTR